jgi:hypothetical protein
MSQSGFTGRGPTQWRGFWAFFGIGFAANVVFYTAWLIWAVVAADFLQPHPSQTAAEAWHQIGTSPFVAISLTIFSSLLAIVISAMAAKFVCEMTGRCPLSLVAVLLLVCVVAVLLQMTMIGLHSQNMMANHGQGILRVAVSQVPMLLMFWLWGREPVAVPAASTAGR